ncbi:MAG TPA: gephyrin-like molybdotransferase Glp [Anaeromyxobacteraceae bacterium]|jgi:molybdopterin molybdotransferase
MDRIERIRQGVLDAVGPLAPERLAVGAAAGRWLAAPALAEVAAPPATCSAMDGWAVRSADAGGGPLAVAMTVYAGQPPPRPLAPGEAARVFTGAALPEGADAVVREELASEEAGRVRFREAPRPLENVRRAGEDVPRGGVALPAGERLGARQLGLCAAVGVREVEVVRRPRVALLATGDEVVGGGTPDSNGAALAAALSSAGMEVRRLAVGDDLGAVAEAIGTALAGSDAVVTIGGVSVGVRDHVPAAVARLGGEVRVHGVPMKPGKPFLFALARGRPLLGLPGSPSACLVAFEVFARPALLRLAGAARPLRRRAFLPLAERAEGRPGRARFLWARLEGDGRVRPLGRDAAQVRGPALADALLHLPEGAGTVEEGGAVEAWLLEDDVP